MAEQSVTDLTQSGIYQIVNKVNGKRYIGSAVNIRKRWYAHKHGLRTLKHPNEHLLNSWIKNGKDCFSYEVIEFCEKSELICREQHWIDSLRPEYNIAPFAGSTLGMIHSEETRRKISERNKGNKYSLGREVSEETRAKIGAANRKRRGFKQSPEWVAARVKAHIGAKRSDETRRRISEAMTGKKRPPFTDEHRENLSKARRGWTISPDHMAAFQSGRARRVYTDEQRAAISESLRKSYENGTRSREKTESHKNKIGQFYAKLTDDQVREIRRLRADGMTLKYLAEMFDSNTGTISAICNGKRYRWVD